VAIPIASVVPFGRETPTVKLKGAQIGGLADGHRKLHADIGELRNLRSLLIIRVTE
jgi:hypothetical protein